jgi:hypothetical protein
MSRTDSLRLTRKLITLCLLLAALAVATFRAEERAGACPICPIPYSCNPWTGECQCDCPDIFGNCPASCA